MFYQKGEKGVFLLFTAILLPLIFICVAFAVDIGYAYAGKSKLQNAADASVLAGGYQYDNGTTAVRSTINTYLQNDVGSNKYTINSITYGKKDNDETNAVLITVTVTQDQPTFFSKIIGMGKIPVTVKSSALIVPKKEESNSIFSYAFFGGRLSPNIPPMLGYPGRPEDWTLKFESGSNVIHGPVYTNGATALSDNLTGDGGRYVYLDPGAYSTYVGNIIPKTAQGTYDYWRWTNGRIIGLSEYNNYNDYWRKVHANDVPNKTYGVPSSYNYMYRMAYNDGTKFGKDIVVDSSVVVKNMLSAELSEGNPLTKSIFKYVQDVSGAPLQRRDQNWTYRDDYSDTYGYVYRQPWEFNDWKPYDVIITSGDIVFNPNNYQPSPGHDHVVLISLYGNITINSDSNRITKALVYAPYGKVTYHSGGKFEGSIVGYQIDVSQATTFTHNDFGFNGGSGGSGSSGSGGSGAGSVKLYEDTANAYSSLTNI